MQEYFTMLQQELEHAYSRAAEARKRHFDSEKKVEINVAKDIASRVEMLVGPKGVAEVIRELEGKGKNREEIAFTIAERIAKGEFGDEDIERRVDQALRTGVGILTEGVLVAPTEGISKIKLMENPDGSDYLSIYYAGPIRSAGGTIAGLSAMIGDMIRKKLGISSYRPTESEIERYVEEANIYDVWCARLQYKPNEDDIRTIIRNCPVCIDGEGSEEVEVSVHRDLPRIATNRIRGGVPLVVCEGIAQKASKLLKYSKKFSIEWSWLENIIEVERKEKTEIKKEEIYLDGLVAGRPIFSYPSVKGGFRLRYGKSRTNGMMAKNIHIATMVLLDEFLACGTHIKIERPGKGAVVVGMETIEPPVVLLKDGSVKKVGTKEEAERIKQDVEKILFLGDILINYGDFHKSNHPLLPCGYCEEWWKEEIREKGIKERMFSSAEEAFEFSSIYNVPLHPKYTYSWHNLTKEELLRVREWIKNYIQVDREGERIKSATLPLTEEKIYLERLLIEHLVKDNKIILDGDSAFTLIASLGINKEKDVELGNEDALGCVNKLSGIVIKAKSPTYIGARMGRPEKAKERRMDGNPNVLFPTGSPKNRSLTKLSLSLSSRGEKNAYLELVRMRCTKCKNISMYHRCHICDGETRLEDVCTECGESGTFEKHCGRHTEKYDRRPVDVVSLLRLAHENLGFASLEEVKGVKGLSNTFRIPERLEKGILRAKHDLYAFRDGTIRFDATNVPLTHFYPKEIEIHVKKLQELGYTKDHVGNELKNEDQLVPLKPQDILLSRAGGEYLLRVAKFIDDLFVNFYHLKPFYNAEKKEDLIGHLVLGLSPHTSVAVLCRIIGFTDANVGYAHPYLLAAKRRNADGDEDSVMLLMDALVNFSRSYLSNRIGGTMDSPLIITMKIDPKEIDDEAHSIELVNNYPLTFYKASENFSSPSDVKIKRIKDVLNTPQEYEQIPFTHHQENINTPPLKTRYVQLKTIEEKVQAQFALEDKIAAVDVKDAAERLILSHFLPDIYGNLRSFSRQTFRCIDCNIIYRRVPLIGKCKRCGGKLVLTINRGGIEKYIKVSTDIVKRYGLPTYLEQRLKLVEKEVVSIFEDDKSKQTDLVSFL